MFESPASMANLVLKTYGIESLPVDLEYICEQERTRIKYANLEKLEHITKKKISGAIQKHPERGCTILVNEADGDKRIRFTIAHELGHYFLHMAGSNNKTITSFRMDKSPQEREADRFAAELLMPREWVEREHAKMIIPVSDSLAKKFGVSKKAMRVRLDNLELLYV